MRVIRVLPVSGEFDPGLFPEFARRYQMRIRSDGGLNRASPCSTAKAS